MSWSYSSNQTWYRSETLDLDRSWSELMHITCWTLLGHSVKGDNSFCKFGHVPDLENYPSDLDETRLIRKLVQFPETLEFNYGSQIHTKPATPTFIKNSRKFHSFAAQFCAIPANRPGRDTGLKIGTQAGLDLKWPPRKISILSILENLRYGSSNIVLVCQNFQNQISDPILTCLRSPEPDVRIRTWLESIERSLYVQKLCLLNRSRQTDQKGTTTPFRGQGQTLLFSGHLTLANFFSSSTEPNFTKLSTPTLHHPSQEVVCPGESKNWGGQGLYWDM